MVVVVFVVVFAFAVVVVLLFCCFVVLLFCFFVVHVDVTVVNPRNLP